MSGDQPYPIPTQGPPPCPICGTMAWKQYMAHSECAGCSHILNVRALREEGLFGVPYPGRRVPAGDGS